MPFPFDITDADGKKLVVHQTDNGFRIACPPRVDFNNPDDLIKLSLILELAASRLRSSLDGTPYIPEGPPEGSA